jgi:hypothetical protein
LRQLSVFTGQFIGDDTKLPRDQDIDNPSDHQED